MSMMRSALEASAVRLAGAALLVALAAGTVLAAPRIGEPAPEFTAVDSKGRAVRLSDYRGKLVVLEWTNHDCPFVKKHYGSGNMQSLQKDAAARDIVWLSVISSAPGEQGQVDGPEADKLTASRSAAPSAVLLDPDGTVGRLYDARATPHMYVIRSDGTLAYSGAIDDKPTSDVADIKTAKNLVRNALDAIAAGKPVDPAATRAYGCSVKYKS